MIISTQEGFIDKLVEMMTDKQNPFSWGFRVCVYLCVFLCVSPETCKVVDLAKRREGFEEWCEGSRSKEDL